MTISNRMEPFSSRISSVITAPAVLEAAALPTDRLEKESVQASFGLRQLGGRTDLSKRLNAFDQTSQKNRSSIYANLVRTIANNAGPDTAASFEKLFSNALQDYLKDDSYSASLKDILAVVLNTSFPGKTDCLGNLVSQLSTLPGNLLNEPLLSFILPLKDATESMSPEMAVALLAKLEPMITKVDRPFQRSTTYSHLGRSYALNGNRRMAMNAFDQAAKETEGLDYDPKSMALIFNGVMMNECGFVEESLATYELAFKSAQMVKNSADRYAIMRVIHDFLEEQNVPGTEGLMEDLNQYLG